MNDELAAALEIAREAGRDIMRRIGGELGVELKPGDEPVTIADRAASDLIVARLAQRFPDDPVISEERPPAPGALTARRVWLVDPIDGTKDFIRYANGDLRSDGFSVMIGLLVAGRPAMGVVHQPTVERTFFASAAGAFVEHGPTRSVLRVSSIASAADARLVASASHRSPDIDRVKSALHIDTEQNIGSVGIKLALIAKGERDLYVNPWPKTKAWDTCAPEAILAAAGGRLTDLFGDPIRYDVLHHPRGLLASNGRVHDEVVAKIAPLFERLRDATA